MTTLAAGAVLVAIVVGVYDGDTITLQDGPRVRLAGIAAPELAEWGGGAAADVLRSLALGREATCTAAGYRSYDREVMACTVEGLDVGHVMIATGLARGCRVRGGVVYRPVFDRADALPRVLPGYCR